MTQNHPALSHSPDPAISSARPGTMAAEFGPIDKRVGWLVVNRLTYRLVRFLLAKAAPEFDTSGVDIRDADELGTGTKLVTPLEPRASGNASGALILIHGGGMVMGSPSDILPQATQIARNLGIPVICAGYRLAPEAPFPAPLDDCHTVWNKVLHHAAALDVDPDKLVIGGYSAGAGLAAGLALRLLDEGGPQPAAQLLVYPMLEDRTAARRELDTPRHRVWSNRNNLFGWRSYLGCEPGTAAHEYAAPARREDFTGLPPAWIGVGTCDLFLDEDRAYARALADAGVDTTYLEVAGGIHAFDAAGTDIARAFVAAQHAFIAQHTS